MKLPLFKVLFIIVFSKNVNTYFGNYSVLDSKMQFMIE